jgi:PAS domain S-box-containing protein
MLDFQALFDASPNPYMVLDRQLRFVTANPAYLHVTGTTLADLVGRTLFDAFPNDPANPNNRSATMLRESLERVLATGQTDVLALIPYRVDAKDGSAIDRYWSATHSPVVDEHGDVAYILQHTVDVTALHAERRRAAGESAPGWQAEAGVLTRARLVQEANSALDAERRHLRSLFEQAPGFMVFLRGPQHVFELANHAYYALVGRRDILDKPVREALPEVRGQGFTELLDTVYATGESYVGRGVRLLVQRTPAGPPEEAFVDFVYQPIRDAAGEVSGIFVQGNDITAQHLLAAELQALLGRERLARETAEAAERRQRFLA